MGYELEIARNVESWLAELRTHSPDEARLIDGALDTLRADGAAVGPPLVVPVDYRPGSGSISPDLDFCYQVQVMALSRLRGEAAEAATLRADLERHLNQPMTDDQRSLLRAAYERIRAQEEKVTEASQRMHREVDAFRTRKESLKASCYAAVAQGMTLLFEASLASGAAEKDPPVLMELRPGAPDGIIAHLLFTPTSAGRAYIFTAATTNEVLRSWLAVAVPAEYPEYGLRAGRASDSG